MAVHDTSKLNYHTSGCQGLLPRIIARIIDKDYWQGLYSDLRIIFWVNDSLNILSNLSFYFEHTCQNMLVYFLLKEVKHYEISYITSYFAEYFQVIL